jgi:hypothetical protein
VPHTSFDDLRVYNFLNSEVPRVTRRVVPIALFAILGLPIGPMFAQPAAAADAEPAAANRAALVVAVQDYSRFPPLKWSASKAYRITQSY